MKRDHIKEILKSLGEIILREAVRGLFRELYERIF